MRYCAYCWAELHAAARTTCRYCSPDCKRRAASVIRYLDRPPAHVSPRVRAYLERVGG